MVLRGLRDTAEKFALRENLPARKAPPSLRCVGPTILSIVRNFFLSLSLVLAAAHDAFAGACINAYENDMAMEGIEAFAKDRKSGPRVEELNWDCAETDAIRLKARIERACRVILDRDGSKSPCARLAAVAGFAQLGKHDIYTLALNLPEDPVAWESVQGITRVTMLGRMGDPRGVKVILETWNAAMPRAEQSAKRHDRMQAWSLWRQQAAAALGAIGSPAEIAFLDAQAKATQDTYVAKECRKAIAAIEKRAATQLPR